MKVLSVNIGKTQHLKHGNDSVATAIFKDSVNAPVKVQKFQLENDEQADLHFHGGKTKAIYSYDISYYDYWKTVLPNYAFQHGNFGENLTTENLPDDKVNIGDVFSIGSTIIQAMEPRFPCSKLNLRFNMPEMVKLFRLSEKNGIYFSVIQEGFIKAGDKIELIRKSEFDISISNIVLCYNSKGEDQTLLNKILQIPILPTALKNNLEDYVR
jgi:MOSC domain-containing protein YiiM